MQYLLIAAAVAIAIMGGATALMYKRVQVLNQAVAMEKANVQTAKDALKESEQTIDSLQQQAEQQAQRLEKLGEDVQQIRAVAEERQVALDAFRDRLRKVSLKRPGLVAKRATRAYNRMLDEFFLATGGKQKRGKDNDDPSSDAATGTAPSARKGSGTDAGSDKGDERKGGQGEGRTLHLFRNE